ncbi:MAG: pilus assembly protein, partial [Betaproteobacteria bacterium]|nr:pilus assembly protein [Betaproteobacteria bacterium]
MKTIFAKFLYLALAIVGILVQGARAEDIDLYVSGNPSANAPNVLIYLDNSSNWSTASQNWSYCGVKANCGSDTACIGYAQSIFGVPSDDSSYCGSKKTNNNDVSMAQGSVEAGALRVVLNELVCQADKPLTVNVGLMVFQPNGAPGGTPDSNGAVGSYIRHAVLPLVKGGSLCDPSGSTATSLIADLNAIWSNINSPPFKAPSSSGYAGGMFEAFKYYGGYTDPSRAINNSPSPLNDGQGTPIDAQHFGPARYANLTGYEDPAAFTDGAQSTYASPITTSNSCGKNYVLLIGNGYPAPTADSKTAAITNLNNYSPPTSGCCGTVVSDVWAQFLSTTDVSYVSGQQPVFTYTVNVSNAKPSSSQIALLKNMAIKGGTGVSGYYEVGGRLQDLINGFKDIFTSIAAVNSVFASSSLPVSVNTQGTYVNQVFIGMFRPDSDARERWNG